MKTREAAAKIVTHLVDGYQEASQSDEASILAKRHWMIQRFNAAVAKAHRGMDAIEVNP